MKMQTTAVSFSITLYLVKMGWLGIKENKWKKKKGGYQNTNWPWLITKHIIIKHGNTR